MERLNFTDFKVSIKLTNVPNTIAANRLLSEKNPVPAAPRHHRGRDKWSGSLKSAVGLGTLLADSIGDTIRISLSTFHAEEEVKVAWEILKAHKLRERGPVLIACPTCGRLQFDMDASSPRSSAAWRPTMTRSRSPSWAAPSTAPARPATPTSASPAPRTWDDLLQGRADQRRSPRRTSWTSSSPRSTNTMPRATSSTRRRGGGGGGRRLAGRGGG